MGIHLISTLGTNLYEPVHYDGAEQQDEYIQVALLRRHKDMLTETGKVTVFVTSSALKSNWEDRDYNDRDADRAKGWGSDKQIQTGIRKRGLNSQVSEEFPDVTIEKVDIPDGRTEEEQRQIFMKMYESLAEGDEIILDLTHAFRSIPILAITMLNYAKVLKGVTIRGIFYGAYEAKSGDTVPIFDLTFYDQLMDWTKAADAYVRFSDIKPVYSLYQGVKATRPGREWKDLGAVVGDMTNLSEALLTCRGADAVALGEKKAKNAKQSSIKNAYSAFKNSVQKMDSNNKKDEISMLYPILERVKADYAIFDKTRNYEIGLSAVEWSIRNGMVQQGYTALEETIKTYLCEYHQLDWVSEKVRDGQIGLALNLLKKYERDHLLGTKEEQAKRIVQKITDCSDDKLSASDQEKLFGVICDIPTELVRLAGKVKERRNDINHFGIREYPLKAQNLIKGLKDARDGFLEIIQNMEKDKAEGDA